MMSEPAQKCENQAIFKQNYTVELFISLEMVYNCCFSLEGNLDFLDFLQKSFKTSITDGHIQNWNEGILFSSFVKREKAK